MHAKRPPLLALALVLQPAAALVVPHAHAEAQERAAVVVRAGLAVPVESPAGLVTGDDLGSGTGFAVQLTMRRSPTRVLYVGFGQYALPCAAAVCAPDGRLVSTSWNVGYRLTPFRLPLAPWVQAGAVLDRSELDLVEGSGATRRSSRLAGGAEAGAGVRIGVGTRGSLEPGVRYTRVDARFPGRGVARLRLLVAEVGFNLAF